MNVNLVSWKVVKWEDPKFANWVKSIQSSFYVMVHIVRNVLEWYNFATTEWERQVILAVSLKDDYYNSKTRNINNLRKIVS